MSLKTRCPACDTVFKIVPDQLKVSKGWVRCGRCAEVFDAAAHAQAPDEAKPWPQTSPPETIVQSTVALSSVTNTTNTASSTTVSDFSKNAVITPKNIASETINTPAKANLHPSKEPTEADLSFVKAAKNKAFWQQKRVIASLRAACLSLVGLLFFQVVFSQRNHLAAANPALATSFESVCQAVGCKMEHFKNIDAFKIESSSFQKTPGVAGNVAGDADQAHVYALKLTLKNSSDISVTMPAIELTLTEAGDKPVLRRVLLAKDLGFNSATLAANSDWTGEITVAVNANPATAPVSGYRVLLFYP